MLRSDFLTQGPAVERFERRVAEHCGANHGVAVSSATAALHLAYRALGLGAGDLLWTSPNTFVATANAALLCGASVDFVDIDPGTKNLSPEALVAKLSEAKKNGRLPKIVVPVHFAGQPCDMEAIGALAREFGFRVVEDASHAIGAQRRGRWVGAGAFSDATVFSFHPVKVITTGEGGMVVTNRGDLAESVRLLRSHGITRDPARLENLAEGPWYYEQIDLGLNYRLTDIQAALGMSQMDRLTAFIDRRHQLADRYDRGLSGLLLELPFRVAGDRSALHLYPVGMSREPRAAERRRVFDSLRAAGVSANVHYIPVYQQPYYRRLGFKPGLCPAAERYYAGAISLPMFPGLTDADQDRVIDVLRSALA